MKEKTVETIKSTPPAAIGAALAAARERAGLSMAKAAQAVGVGRISLSRWERGIMAPTLQHVIALSRLYGESIDELLGL